VARLALIGLIVFYILRKRKQKERAQTEMVQTGDGDAGLAPVEMHTETAQEMPAGAMGYKSTALEIEQPPAELEGAGSGKLGRDVR
jgi:hypothetical protein